MPKRRVYFPQTRAITVRPQPFRRDKIRQIREMEKEIRKGIKKIEEMEKEK